MDLPALDAEEADLLDAMRRHLGDAIARAGGALPFDRFMELALYAPRLGYYVNGRRRFGEGGDFTTAPEISPLFGACLANQCATCLGALGGGSILEFGAGSGRLAVDLLRRLEVLGALPQHYQILELSPDLRQLQHETLMAEVPHLLERVLWLEALPPRGFRGVMLANELIDAMPVHRFRRSGGGDWEELFVVSSEEGLSDRWVGLRSTGLAAALRSLWPDGATPDPGYRSEVNLRLRPWLEAVAGRFEAGWMLLVDYGYSRREYYHHERGGGTLICHFRHRAHDDPYLLPGLQDITANVDFTALAEAATSAGFDVAGYTTQAHFLIDSGLESLMAESDPLAVEAHLALVQGVKRLTLPTEMGERFKVMALARGVDDPLPGFRTRDLRGRL